MAISLILLIFSTYSLPLYLSMLVQTSPFPFTDRQVRIPPIFPSGPIHFALTQNNLALDPHRSVVFESWVMFIWLVGWFFQGVNRFNLSMTRYMRSYPFHPRHFPISLILIFINAVQRSYHSVPCTSNVPFFFSSPNLHTAYTRSSRLVTPRNRNRFPRS